MAVRTLAQRTWPAGTDIRLMMVLDPAILAGIKTAPPPTEASSAYLDIEAENGIKKLLEGYREPEPVPWIGTIAA